MQLLRNVHLPAASRRSSSAECSDVLDFHCHRPPAGFGPEGQDAARPLRVVQWDVSAAQPPDAVMYAAGLHPWHIPGSGGAEMEALLARLRAVALRSDVRMVGETGLDGLRNRFTSDAAYAAQERVFAAQAALAEQLRKPLLLHVVRRYGEVLRQYRALRPSVPWVLHGFAKGPALWRQLSEAGWYGSFGAALLRDGPVADAWRQADLRRVFLETDESGIRLAVLYERAAWLRQMPVERLEDQMEENFLQLTDI